VGLERASWSIKQIIVLKRNILITGANGQLGNELQGHANQGDLEFHFTDVEELDIADQEQVDGVFKENAFDFCINCAAYTAVDRAEDEKELAHRINARGVECLAKACESNSTTLIHISTDFVYNGLTNVPYKETTDPSPLGMYGLSKLNGELMALGNCDNSFIIRTSWLYSSFGRNFVKTIMRLSGEKESIDVVYDQIGSPTYAADLARTLVHMIKTFLAQPGSVEEKRGIYHYSNEGVCTWYDLACAVVDYKSLPLKVNPIRTEDYPSRAKRPHYSVLDKSKIKAAFDIDIPHWQQSLHHCLDLL
jgi:dTDP-4-dehydrorhamnose reductase